MTVPKPFRVLPMDEFERLTTAEKAEYLRDAVEVQKRVMAQYERYLTELEEKRNK